jgi:SAM-dependent methyltransferase
MPNWILRLFFWLAYRRGRTPWDTNVTPPELVRAVEGPDALPPGRALDLGCGTGTNAIYLALHGWEVVGVDFVDKAIRQARKKAVQAGAQVRFYAGDVTRLEKIKGLTGSFDLVLDIGCLHSLTPEGRARYAAGMVSLLRSGATFLLYAWEPWPGRSGDRGLSPEQVKAFFAPHLRATWVQHGQDRKRPAAWYGFERTPEK